MKISRCQTILSSKRIWLNSKTFSEPVTEKNISTISVYILRKILIWNFQVEIFQKSSHNKENLQKFYWRKFIEKFKKNIKLSDYKSRSKYVNFSFFEHLIAKLILVHQELRHAWFPESLQLQIASLSSYHVPTSNCVSLTQCQSYSSIYFVNDDHFIWFMLF
jgi:hypothetical protein